MPLFLAIAGLVLIVAGIRGKESDLLAQLTDDGKHFIVWFLLIVGVGVVGLSSRLRPVSNAFLTLIVVAFFLGSYNSIIAGFKQLTSASQT